MTMPRAALPGGSGDRGLTRPQVRLAQANDLLIRCRRDRPRGSLIALAAFADQLARDHPGQDGRRTPGYQGG